VACLGESQALAFVAGKLTADARAEALDHTDECDACRRLLAALVRQNAPTPDGDTMLAPEGTLPVPAVDHVAKAVPAEWAAGTRVGHYVVLARIGAGGMGAVYRAEDVDLGRAVALKRLHVDASETAKARLMREARAAAALQHPNVVTVHEVAEEAGTPFLAMELVDGVTLTAWLKERTRTSREIAHMIAQSGRGLAAAHAQGLVHRDFKPDNVLVDRVGRARVADFGLARAGDSPPDTPATPSSGKGLGKLTATGSLAGTPAYMAPEIVGGAEPSPKSDQYALAITLYEALHGHHPFEGTSATALWAEMATGRIRAGKRRIPRWLDRAVRRGLEVEPEKRWPDVAALVRELERPRRGWIYAGAGAGVVAAAAAVLLVRGHHGPDCDQVARDVRVAVTHEDLKRAIHDPAQLALATAAVDQFTGDLRYALRESCRATSAGTQSAALGDKRSACIEQARRRAFFVLDGIGSGANVATSIEDLPDVTACSDPEWLARSSPLPVAQADRDKLFAAEQQLAGANRQRDAGDITSAQTAAKTVHDNATNLGDRELAARAALLLGEIDRDRGDMRQAELDDMDAWESASNSGDTQLTIRAQVAMLGAASSHETINSFAGLGKDAEDSAEGARLVEAYANALAEAGKLKEAEAQYRRAQAIREHVLPEGHIERALGLEKLGAILAVEKKPTDALALFDKAQPVIEKAFPPLRREAIEGLRFRAMAEEDLGHGDHALELYKEVLARRTKVLGPDAGIVLDARAEVARTLGDLGHAGDAAAELEKIVAGHLARDGEKSVNAANARLDLANQLITLGRFDEADAALAKALPVIAAAHGEDSPYVDAVRYAQVRSLVERPQPKDVAKAAAILDQVEPVFAKLFGASSQPVAACRLERARVLIAQGDGVRAEAQAASAIAMLTEANLSDRAELELVRAKALRLSGRRDDAHAAADAAARDYDAAGAGFADRAKAARDWAAGASVHP
jgi:tetratricopeptide (TPR) repeat protein